MKIGDICTYAPKSQIKAGEAIDGAEYMFFTSSSDENKRYSEFQIDGEGIVMGTGGSATLHYYSGKFATSTDCVVLLPSDQVRCKYLYYFLKANMNILEAGFKGAGLKHTNKKYISEINIPQIPEHIKQDEVILVLDKLQTIIDLRNEELTSLDYLIKARFVEMFGDPAINPMNWDKVNISEVVGGKISNGFFAKRDDYVDDGNVSVMGVAYVVNRMYSQWQDLPKTNGTDKDIEKFEVKYGDMLFCRSSLVAEGIGKASIVPEDVPNNTLFECHVIRFPLDLNKCVPEYMQVLSTTEFFRQQIIAQSKTATMTTIGQNGILKADIILPPLEKQKEFYAFVKQIDKSKATVQKALDETQLLFDSLMQQYFG